MKGTLWVRCAAKECDFIVGPLSDEYVARTCGRIHEIAKSKSMKRGSKDKDHKTYLINVAMVKGMGGSL